MSAFFHALQFGLLIFCLEIRVNPLSSAIERRYIPAVQFSEFKSVIVDDQLTLN